MNKDAIMVIRHTRALLVAEYDRIGHAIGALTEVIELADREKAEIRHACGADEVTPPKPAPKRSRRWQKKPAPASAPAAAEPSTEEAATEAATEQPPRFQMPISRRIIQMIERVGSVTAAEVEKAGIATAEQAGPILANLAKDGRIHRKSLGVYGTLPGTPTRSS